MSTFAAAYNTDRTENVERFEAEYSGDKKAYGEGLLVKHKEDLARDPRKRKNMTEDQQMYSDMIACECMIHMYHLVSTLITTISFVSLSCTSLLAYPSEIGFADYCTDVG